MTRLIDANALRTDFVDRYHKAEDWITKAEDIFIKTRAEATRDFIGEIIMTIDNAPTVEPICPYLSDDEVKQPCLQAPCERPQGEWEIITFLHSLNKYKCNQCQHYLYSGMDKNFCPNCGAKMKGGAE